jgi:hypothetical protein
MVGKYYPHMGHNSDDSENYDHLCEQTINFWICDLKT